MKPKLDPKKMRNWTTIVRLGQKIILVNLIAFALLMLIVDIALVTRPHDVTSEQARVLHQSVIDDQ